MISKTKKKKEKTSPAGQILAKIEALGKEVAVIKEIKKTCKAAKKDFNKKIEMLEKNKEITKGQS